MSRWLIAGVVAAVIVIRAPPGEAAAASRLIYFRTEGASACPNEEALRSAVAQRLGYDPFFAWAEQIVVVKISAASGWLRARLELVDAKGLASGARELSARAGEGALTVARDFDREGVGPVAPPSSDEKFPNRRVA
jgi:hypothetical protein